MNRWLEPRERPLVLGHRGARGLAPENTLESIALALDLGCDGVEIDVHLTRDGIAVVHHDDEFARCTDVAARFPGRERDPVRSFTHAEVARLDAGSWFAAALSAATRPRPLDARRSEEERRFPPPRDPLSVPTLRAVLELIRARGALVDIELKALPRRARGPLLEAVVDAVREAGLEEAALLTSFDHEFVARAAALAPATARGILCLDHLADAAAYAQSIAQATHVLPCARGESDLLGGDADVRAAQTYPAWRAWRRTGLRVIPWVVDDPALARELRFEIDGLITDFPPRVLEGLRRSPTPSP